jgi:hypothetical protein
MRFYMNMYAYIYIYTHSLYMCYVNMSVVDEVRQSYYTEFVSSVLLETYWNRTHTAVVTLRRPECGGYGRCQHIMDTRNMSYCLLTVRRHSTHTVLPHMGVTNAETCQNIFFPLDGSRYCISQLLALCLPTRLATPCIRLSDVTRVWSQGLATSAAAPLAIAPAASFQGYRHGLAPNRRHEHSSPSR